MTWIGDGAHTARRTARRHTSTYRYVNGFSISVKTQLHPGDTITFGTGPTSQSSSTLCALPPHTLRLSSVHHGVYTHTRWHCRPPVCTQLRLA
jgi:hypothetical protein